MVVGTPTAAEEADLNWSDRFFALRDRLLSSARFRSSAGAFPLTRAIAQRRARLLFDLCAGFVYSQVLLACIRLRLFEILSEGPQALAVLSRRMTLSDEAATRLLAAAVSLGLVTRRSKGRYALGPLGAPLVGNAAIAAMVEHHAILYADLRDPVALLRGGPGQTQLARYWPYAGSDMPAQLPLDRVAAYSALMSASQALIAGEVLDSYAFGRHRCLLDIGGGDGTFLAAVAARVPDLSLILFDLPPVADRARQRFAAAGLAGRATAVGGDFLADPLPEGADLISLVRVIHDHHDEQALAILCAARRALASGGALLLAEPMSGTAGAEPMGDAYFGFYLLAMGRGRPRSVAELGALLKEAGFGQVRRMTTRFPLQTSVLLARLKPD